MYVYILCIPYMCGMYFMLYMYTELCLQSNGTSQRINSEWHILCIPCMCGIKSVIHVCVYLMYTIYVWHVLYAVQCTCMLNSVYTWLNMFKWHIWCIPLYVACTLCCTCMCGMKSMSQSEIYVLHKIFISYVYHVCVA